MMMKKKEIFLKVMLIVSFIAMLNSIVFLFLRELDGLAIKIYYNDSSCEIITWECTVYIKDNKRNYGWEYFDMDSFNATLQSYLDSN